MAADKGDPDGLCNMGKVCFYGNGTAKNLSEAARFFKLAAQQKNPEALFCLGTLYESGEGVPKDIAMAKKLYTEAAALGSEDGAAALKGLKK